MAKDYISILHTADWHLGKRLDRFLRHQEQIEVLNEIVELAETHRPDVVVIAGDIFDTINPPNDSQELYFETIERLARNGEVPVLIIAGNHDSPDKIEMPDALANRLGILLAGYPRTKINPRVGGNVKFKISASDEGFIRIEKEGWPTPLNIIHNAYANEVRLAQFLSADGERENQLALTEVLANLWQKHAENYLDPKHNNLLVSHHFFVPASGEIGYSDDAEDEKPVTSVGGSLGISTSIIPKQIQYTALGHIHRYIEVQKGERPVVYSSSPLSYSFSEAGQTKFVVLAKLKAGEPTQIEKLPLTKGFPLKKISAENLNELKEKLETEGPNTYTEVTITTEEPLNPTERRLLLEQFKLIVSLKNPILRELDEAESTTIDLSQNPIDLFKQFYAKGHKGTEPSAALVDLFKEVLANRND